MPIADFNTLYGLDLGPYISKKPIFKWDRDKQKMVKTDQALDYLNWADMMVLLHENGAEKVDIKNIHGPDGHSVFLSCGSLPEVHVYVEIDGDRREITYPVIEGTKDISMDKIGQLDVHKASQRAAVKCVAVNWGLGLKLWQKEERLPPPTPAAETASVYDRLQRKANAAAIKLGGAAELGKTISFKEAEIKKILSSSRVVSELETALDGVLYDHQ